MDLIQDIVKEICKQIVYVMSLWHNTKRNYCIMPNSEAKLQPGVDRPVILSKVYHRISVEKVKAKLTPRYILPLLWWWSPSIYKHMNLLQFIIVCPTFTLFYDMSGRRAPNILYPLTKKLLATVRTRNTPISRENITKTTDSYRSNHKSTEGPHLACQKHFF